MLEQGLYVIIEYTNDYNDVPPQREVKKVWGLFGSNRAEDIVNKFKLEFPNSSIEVKKFNFLKDSFYGYMNQF